MSGWVEKIGVFSGTILPIFNIPLIARIVKRKSSDDLSLSWAIGVWVCIVLMTPQALKSNDLAFKMFGVSNIIFFSLVVFFVLKYRSKPKPPFKDRS